MRRSRPTRLPRGVAIAALLSALIVAGCGSSGAEQVSAPAPSVSAFPQPDGRSLEQIAADVGLREEVVVSPAGRVFRVGENRFGFGVFTLGREQVEDAEVAIYAGQGAGGKALGPFPASRESLATKPAFVAKNTADDPDAITVVYASRLRLPARGEWRLLAVLRDGERLGATRAPSIEAGRSEGVPAPGEPAPRIHTPTKDDVADIAEIDTRIPPGTMHEVDFADVLDKKPVVLLFATPALCQSRVCGPVVDVAEQVKSELAGEDVAFIHMEVYRDNDVAKGLRPQLRAYGLPTEPWLFVIDRDGRVATAIEGGFGVKELRGAVERVVRG